MIKKKAIAPVTVTRNRSISVKNVMFDVTFDMQYNCTVGTNKQVLIVADCQNWLFCISSSIIRNVYRRIDLSWNLINSYIMAVKLMRIIKIDRYDDFIIFIWSDGRGTGHDKLSLKYLQWIQGPNTRINIHNNHKLKFLSIIRLHVCKNYKVLTHVVSLLVQY